MRLQASHARHTLIREAGPAGPPDAAAMNAGTNPGSVDTYALADVCLIAVPAGSRSPRRGALTWSVIDCTRFTVPVASVYAGPNRKYLGSKRGVTWLNMVKDRGLRPGVRAGGLTSTVSGGTEGILRVVPRCAPASSVRMTSADASRGWNLTPLRGGAGASYGRLFKSLHVVVYIDDDRDIAEPNRYDHTDISMLTSVCFG